MYRTANNTPEIQCSLTGVHLLFELQYVFVVFYETEQGLPWLYYETPQTYVSHVCIAMSQDDFVSVLGLKFSAFRGKLRCNEYLITISFVEMKSWLLSSEGCLDPLGWFVLVDRYDTYNIFQPKFYVTTVYYLLALLETDLCPCTHFQEIKFYQDRTRTL